MARSRSNCSATPWVLRASMWCSICQVFQDTDRADWKHERRRQQRCGQSGDAKNAVAYPADGSVEVPGFAYTDDPYLTRRIKAVQVRGNLQHDHVSFSRADRRLIDFRLIYSVQFGPRIGSDGGRPVRGPSTCDRCFRVVRIIGGPREPYRQADSESPNPVALFTVTTNTRHGFRKSERRGTQQEGQRK